MKLNKIMLAVLASVLVSSSALAATATGDMTVTTTVSNNCTLTVNAMSFGAWDPRDDAVKDATATVVSKCTADIPYDIHADVGAGTDATLAARSMQGTGDNLDEPVYSLYTNSGHTTVWGDGVTDGSGEISGITTGDDQTATIYGRIAINQSGMAADSYSDTVGVTLTY